MYWEFVEKLKSKYKYIKGICKRGSAEICIVIYIIIIFALLGYGIYYSYYIIKNIYYLNNNLVFDTEQVNKLNNLARYCNPSIEYFTNNSLIESYTNPDKEDLKKIGGIPVSFFNKNINSYQDLIVSDFYWAASYKSYLSGSATYGIPNLKSLQINITDFNMTFINLDIYSSKNTVNHPDAMPVVRSEILAAGATSLVFIECLRTIKRAWQNNAIGGISPPLFLYLNLNFNNDSVVCNTIRNDLISVFGKMFIDVIHSFIGRQEKFPISEAKIKDVLGKVIIITNIFPTGTSLDEYIHSSTIDQYHKTNLIEYKDDFIQYDGIKLTNSASSMIENNMKSLSIVYASKAGGKSTHSLLNSKLDIMNPDFIDCSKYGLQIVMMSPMLYNKYMKDWVLFFNKESMKLKPKSLRWVSGKKLTTYKQDERLSYAPTAVQIIPGFAQHVSSGFPATKHIS